MIDLVRRTVGRFASKIMEVGSAMSYEIANIVSLAIVFPIITQSFGPANYGVYTTLYVIAGFATTWVSSSVAAAVVQLLVQRGRSIDSVLAIGQRQVLVAAVPLAIVGTLASVALFGTKILLPAVFIFFSDLIVIGVAQVYLATVFAVRGVTASTRIRLLTPLVRTSGVVVCALTGNVTLLAIAMVSSAAPVVTVAVARRTARRLTTADLPESTTRIETLPTTSRELWRLSSTYAGTMSAIATQSEGEKIVLAGFRPEAEVGEYQAAYRIAALAIVPLQAVQTVAQRWALVPDDRANIHVRRCLRLSIPIAVYGVAAGIAIAVGRPLVRLAIGDQFDLALEIVIWLAAFPLLRALSDVPMLGLIGLNRNRERMFLGIGGAVFALVAYFSLVPWWGWRGAVTGTYLSEIAVLTGGWILLRRCQRIADDEASRRGPAGSVWAAPAQADPIV